MKLCIPPKIVSLIKAANITTEKIRATKNTEELKALYSPFIKDKQVLNFVAYELEKAIASKDKTALKRQVNKLLSAKDPAKTKSIVDHIENITDKYLLNPNSRKATLTSIFSQAMGFQVTTEQMMVLSEKASKARVLQKAMDEKIAESKKKGLSGAEHYKSITKSMVDYNVALTDIDIYINQQVPDSLMKTITGGILRSNLLTGMASAITNFISNKVQVSMQALERRLASGQITGVEYETVKSYVDMARAIYDASGRDISRNMSENFVKGERILNVEGKHWLQKFNKFQNKIVYHYMLGYDDMLSASFTRIDSAILQARDIAKAKGLAGLESENEALTIIKDATNLDPKGEDATIVAAQSIADAEAATWTNKTWASKVSLKFRDWMNDATGDFQLGYWTVPFVKTSANVIQFGIDASVFGFAQPLYKFKSAWETLNNENIEDDRVRKAPMKEVIRLATRAGMGSLLSLILASLIPPDDFIGGYEQVTEKQRAMMGLKKGVYNAVKIGGKWISLDYFGALGSGFVGMMYARKYGKGLFSPETAFHYARGAGGQAMQVPGIQNFADLWVNITDSVKEEDPKKAALGLASDLYNTLSGRVIPGYVSAMAKTTDPYERKIDRADFLSKTKASIPGLRRTLPAKINQTTGQKIKSEAWWSILLFGSRVKTANESALINEISRLDNAGYAPTISNIEKYSKSVQGLKEQISSARFEEAIRFFGREFGRKAEMAIRRASYKRLNDEEKQKILNKIRDDIRSKMLKKFHYRKKKK